MKLLTKTIAGQIPGIYSTDGVPFAEKRAVAKFFDPTGRATWFVFEGDVQREMNPGFESLPLNMASASDLVQFDVRFFGYVVSPLGPDCDEMGYFTLSELQSVRLRFGLRVERDTFFRPETMANLETENGVREALLRNAKKVG